MTKPPSTALAKRPRKPRAKVWAWTAEKEQCLTLALAGWPKLRIAAHIGVNRNTVTSWCQAPEFVDRFHSEQEEHQLVTRQRRLREANRFADRLAAVAAKALDVAEKNPQHTASRFAARDWLSEFRAFRNEERTDSGENVQRHEVIGAVQHQHQLTNQSFKGFLTKAIDAGVVDAEIIEGDNVQEVLVTAVRDALVDSDALDELNTPIIDDK
jgi:hypothetical protein